MKAVPLCFDGLLWPCCEPVVTTFPQTIYPHLKNVYVSLKVYAWNKRGFDFLLNKTLHLPGGHFEVEVAEGGRQLRLWQVPSLFIVYSHYWVYEKVSESKSRDPRDLFWFASENKHICTGVYIRYISISTWAWLPWFGTSRAKDFPSCCWEWRSNHVVNVIEAKFYSINLQLPRSSIKIMFYMNPVEFDAAGARRNLWNCFSRILSFLESDFSTAVQFPGGAEVLRHVRIPEVCASSGGKSGALYFHGVSCRFR
jgi:hypothetical protein